jgi:PAS domain S-box-containing protein
MTMNHSAITTERRTRDIYEEHKRKVYVRTDRMFVWLMPIQWVAGLVIALWLYRGGWPWHAGAIDPHIWTALFLGGAITLWPVFCALEWPGVEVTRQMIAIGQMAMSALLIHLCGGRIETHFHIFGSLAFLAFYRDRRVLATASVVIAIDSFVRGMYFPMSIFGTLTASPFRAMEHVGWVLFEDTFLMLSIRQTLKQMMGMAEQQASLEVVNVAVEGKVAERTAELTKEIAERKRIDEARKQLAEQLARERRHFEDILNTIPVVVFENSTEAGDGGQFVSAYVEKMYGYTPEEWTARPDFWTNCVHPEDRERVPEIGGGKPDAGRNGRSGEWRWLAKDGSVVWGDTQVTELTDADGRKIGTRGITVDITERKNAEARAERMQAELLEASRNAGMAEVATNVLHNVGNVLSSVNISHSVITDRVRNSGIANVVKVAELLRRHASDLAGFVTAHPVGRKLPKFLGNLGEWLMQEQQSILSELNLLGRNVEHIKEIIIVQQSDANAGGVHETVPISDLVEAALQINGMTLAERRIEVVREYGEVPPSCLEKQKVMQILVNLIRNAKNALSDSACAERRLEVRTACEDDRISVTVSDTGMGIARENLPRIFSHGFSTQKDGHGFGLHSSAFAAKEMGGQVRVESEGLGRGASFSLDLPLRRSGNGGQYSKSGTERAA